jgi:hypothetical protein
MQARITCALQPAASRCPTWPEPVSPIALWERLMNDEHADEASWHQLAHDINSHLLVVTMGLELLDDARQDTERFMEVLARIRRDGIEPLKKGIAALLESTKGQ